MYAYALFDNYEYVQFMSETVVWRPPRLWWAMVIPKQKASQITASLAKDYKRAASILVAIIQSNHLHSSVWTVYKIFQ